MARELEVGKHYWYCRCEQLPMDIIMVREIVVGGKERIVRGLILDIDNLTIERKDVPEEDVLGSVSQKFLSDYRKKMERMMKEFFR